MTSKPMEDFDITIVGSGFCGSALAVVLSAQRPDLRLKVIDRNAACPQVFRAEKLEPHQYDSMAQLGIEDHIRPIDPTFIDEILVVRGNRERRLPRSSHRGMDYVATVNQLRTELGNSNLIEVANIVSVIKVESGYDLEMADKRIVHTKLLIISTGVDARLAKQLGISDQPDEPVRTTCYGFDAALENESDFPHQAFNFRTKRRVPGLDYVTFFPIGSRMRANVFTCWGPATKNAQEFKSEPIELMQKIFPTLVKKIGKMSLASKVQFYSGTYYRRNCAELSNLAMMGDAYQSVSPATGMGISKCLADIFAMLKVIDRWDGQSRNRVDTAIYYECANKIQVDEKARSAWRWSNQRCTSRSASTRMRLAYSAIRRTKLGEILSRLKS